MFSNPMKIVTSPFLFVFVQMWRYDRSRQRPVNCGHEPLRAGSHAEGAEEQSHSDGYLLAWKPGVGFQICFESNVFLFRLWKETPFAVMCFWLRAADTAGVGRAPNHCDCPFVIRKMAFLKLAWKQSSTNPCKFIFSKFRLSVVRM